MILLIGEKSFGAECADALIVALGALGIYLGAVSAVSCLFLIVSDFAELALGKVRRAGIAVLNEGFTRLASAVFGQVVLAAGYTCPAILALDTVLQSGCTSDTTFILKEISFAYTGEATVFGLAGQAAWPISAT